MTHRYVRRASASASALSIALLACGSTPREASKSAPQPMPPADSERCQAGEIDACNLQVSRSMHAYHQSKSNSETARRHLQLAEASATEACKLGSDIGCSSTIEILIERNAPTNELELARESRLRSRRLVATKGTSVAVSERSNTRNPLATPIGFADFSRVDANSSSRETNQFRLSTGFAAPPQPASGSRSNR